jgi:XisI protein
MDRVTHYRQLIKQALTEYAALLNSPPQPDYEVTLAFDDERQQYLLRRVGWTLAGRLRQTDLHISLRNGKIWIEEDWTEEGIATWFLEQGVPPSDIVLGFQPPQLRSFTEFAMA